MTGRENQADAIIRTWRRLPRLCELTFDAHPGPGSRTGWRGRGHARIDTRADSDAWRCIEQGQFWAQEAGRALAFRNVYRWRRTSDALLLAHERFGAAAPVALVALVAAGPQTLVSRQNHHCGQDRYRATLTLCAQGFVLDWHITGPAKDEHLRYRYRTAGNPPATPPAARPGDG